MNCNDCAYLKRSLVNRQKHVDFHYKMQKDHFNIKRLKLLEKAERWFEKSEKEKAKVVLKEVRKMKFVFSEDSCSLSFGKCSIKQKEISFIPGVVMEENFNCFKHRGLIE